MVRVFKVDGMSCEHCKNRVESAVSEVTGVNSAIVDLNEGTITVDYLDETVEEKIVEAVDQAGYDIIE